ncbi:MAG: tail fiber domain-containing protein [Candidatus Saccharimonas sp.]|nr:tail fiber domain-containing protein [Planctomycetaceae bacterium]
MAIIVGVLSAGQCSAAESVVLDGPNPHVTFDDNDGTLQMWEVFGDDTGFDIIDPTAGTSPFHIDKATPDNSLFIKGVTGQIGIGTAVPDAVSRLDIRSSLLNGLFMRREDAGQGHFMRIETPSGTFRSGVQGTGDAQFGALTAGKGLNLLAGGSTKLLMNSTGQITFGNSPTPIGAHALVHDSGARLSAAGVWQSVSSREAKQDIEPITIEQARDTVRALQPVGYRYKKELDEHYLGFIAEDVPELVATNDRKSLAPMDISAVLTKVVQDQDRQLQDQSRLLQDQGKQLTEERQRNDKLERSVTSLMQRLTDLEQQRLGNSVPAK